MIAYKFLGPDGTSSFTGLRWEIPNRNAGQWIYEVELQGEILEQRSKVVASRGRLLRAERDAVRCRTSAPW